MNPAKVDLRGVVAQIRADSETARLMLVNLVAGFYVVADAKRLDRAVAEARKLEATLLRLEDSAKRLDEHLAEYEKSEAAEHGDQKSDEG